MQNNPFHDIFVSFRWPCSTLYAFFINRIALQKYNWKSSCVQIVFDVVSFYFIILLPIAFFSFTECFILTNSYKSAFIFYTLFHSFRKLFCGLTKYGHCFGLLQFIEFHSKAVALPTKLVKVLCLRSFFFHF